MARKICTLIFVSLFGLALLSPHVQADPRTPLPITTPQLESVCSTKPTVHDSEIRPPNQAGRKPPLVATLVRTCDKNGCVTGELTIGSFKCYTLERPDWFNIPNVSCIPAQTYTCKRYSSQKFPDTYEVTGVPNRTHILFHGGKQGKVTKYDTRGCIGLGLVIDPLKNELYRDQEAVKGFLEALGGYDVFSLVIKNECDKPSPEPTATAIATAKPRLVTVR
jgi:hypothetical protein